VFIKSNKDGLSGIVAKKSSEKRKLRDEEVVLLALLVGV
jgi:hypothetical protein